jgi:hypothetical protein
MSGLADGKARPVASAAEAETLLSELTAARSALEAHLDAESDLIGAGRIRDGLAGEARKTELSSAYVLQLQLAKANVVALARLAPDALRAFRTRQAAFERVMSRNQTVIATARAVAEGLIRGLSEAVQRETRPSVYGAPTRPHLVAQSSAPLVFSGRF